MVLESIFSCPTIFGGKFKEGKLLEGKLPMNLIASAPHQQSDFKGEFKYRSGTLMVNHFEVVEKSVNVLVCICAS